MMTPAESGNNPQLAQIVYTHHTQVTDGGLGDIGGLGSPGPVSGVGPILHVLWVVLNMRVPLAGKGLGGKCKHLDESHVSHLPEQRAAGYTHHTL